MTQALLELNNVETFYGTSQALFGIDFSVREGEFATLLGRNGMGKTTTVRSIMALTRHRSGSITFEGTALADMPVHRIAQLGLGLVPEGRQVFSNLTVLENLVATASNRRGVADPWTVEKIFAMFPSLEQRRRNLSSTLSGGEQQMLAIGRALMTNPRLLILDEATEGLAPVVRGVIWDCLERLKALGQTVLVIDKNIGPLLRLADQHHVVEKGRIVWKGTSADLLAQPEVLHRYIGV